MAAEPSAQDDGIVRWSRILVAVGLLLLFAGIVAFSVLGGGMGSPAGSSDAAPSGVDAPLEAPNDTDDGEAPGGGAGLANDTDDENGVDDGDVNDSAGDDGGDVNAPGDGGQQNDSADDGQANDGNDAPAPGGADSDQDSGDSDENDDSGSGDGPPSDGDGDETDDDGDATDGGENDAGDGGDETGNSGDAGEGDGDADDGSGDGASGSDDGNDSDSSSESGPETVEECRTIEDPGTYEVTQDIGSTGVQSIDLGSGVVRDTCLAIQSSDVVLDGSGSVVSGTDGSLSVGVHVYDPAGSSVQNVTVRDLQVEDWSNGVQVGVDTWAVNPAGPATATVENVQSIDNGHHGFFVVGSGTQLSSVVANDNGASGIGVFESGDVQVNGATTTGNIDHGLGLLEGVFDGTFTDVTTTDNGGAEIYFGEVTAGNVFTDLSFGAEDDTVEGYDGSENSIDHPIVEEGNESDEPGDGMADGGNASDGGNVSDDDSEDTDGETSDTGNESGNESTGDDAPGGDESVDSNESDGEDGVTGGDDGESDGESDEQDEESDDVPDEQGDDGSNDSVSDDGSDNDSDSDEEESDDDSDEQDGEGSDEDGSGGDGDSDDPSGDGSEDADQEGEAGSAD